MVWVGMIVKSDAFSEAWTIASPPPDPRATFPAMPYSPALLKDVAEVVYLAVPPSEALI